MNNKYESAKIYAIVDINYESYYIGSTVEPLSKRMSSHRSHYKAFQNKSPHQNYISSFKLFEKYGVDNCKIILLENVKVNNREELRALEGSYIHKYNCVNINIAGRSIYESKKNYRDNSKDKKKILNFNYRCKVKNLKIERHRQWVLNYINTLN